jgi:hypothetical protein
MLAFCKMLYTGRNSTRTVSKKKSVWFGINEIKNEKDQKIDILGYEF